MCECGCLTLEALRVLTKNKGVVVYPIQIFNMFLALKTDTQADRLHIAVRRLSILDDCIFLFFSVFFET